MLGQRVGEKQQKWFRVCANTNNCANTQATPAFHKIITHMLHSGGRLAHSLGTSQAFEGMLGSEVCVCVSEGVCVLQLSPPWPQFASPSPRCDSSEKSFCFGARLIPH